jgi:penicillin-binding protein 1A
VPIFEPVIQAVWASVAPRTALAPPSPEARRLLACKASEPDSRERRGARGAREALATECLRLDPKGKVVDTQYRLVSREGSYARREESSRPRERRHEHHDHHRREVWSFDPWRGWPPSAYAPRPRDEREWRAPPRADPGYLWGGRRDFFGSGWRHGW